MIGQNLGPYASREKLGEGGMGEVYRARDTQLGRDVAIKILPAQFASDQERIARFQREAQFLASLNHPHIAQIYGLHIRVERCPRNAVEPSRFRSIPGRDASPLWGSGRWRVGDQGTADGRLARV